MSHQELAAEALDMSQIDAIEKSEDSAVANLTDPSVTAVLDDIDIDASMDDSIDKRTRARPDSVPEKFWDVESGAIRTESLLKSYVELERKLGTMMPVPHCDDPSSLDRLQRLLGKPESAEDYQIDPPHELVASDPSINAKLYEAGLSSKQAQLVYNLAAEHLVPLVEEANKKARGRIERSQLAAHFGGEEKWQSVAPQIKTWAEANLSDEVYESLGSSADGVIAIYHMMQTREPHVISEAAMPAAGVDERQLSQMMRDPRYWRDRDPAFVAEVTAGYRRLFK